MTRAATPPHTQMEPSPHKAAASSLVQVATSPPTRLQEGHSLRVYDTAIAGNPEPSGVPPYAFDLTAEALRGGMVLVVSLWSAPDDGLAWLQGPIAQCGAPCDLDEARHSLCACYAL